MIFSRGFLFILALSPLVWCIEIVLKELDVDTYLKWSTLSLRERVPYLMDKFMKEGFQREYAKFVDTDIPDANGVDLTLPVLLHCLSEFQSPAGIRRYFQECDEDESGSIDIVEYSICRGFNGVHGNPSDVSEYDVIENEVLGSFKSRYIDVPRSPLYKYDEDGIIIDL